MNKVISISLFRVSSDSKNLDMIFNCPIPYYFSKFILNVKYWKNGQLEKKSFDLSNLFFVNVLPKTSTDPYPTTNKKHWTIRIPLENLNIVDDKGNIIPGIYKADLTAKYLFKKVVTSSFTYGLPVPYDNELVYEIRYNSGEKCGYVYKKTSSDDNPEKDIFGHIIKGKIFAQCEYPGPDLEDSMICSDVNFVYQCMLDDILSLEDNPCAEVSDDAIRKYLILYGHQSALAVGDEETAEEYFRLLNNCFSICNNSTRTNRRKSCNCNR